MEKIGIPLSSRYFLIPLLGLFAGAGLGRVLAGVPAIIAPLQQALGPLLGPAIASQDNFMIGLGLVGLLLPARIIWFYNQKRLQANNSRPSIVKVLGPP